MRLSQLPIGLIGLLLLSGCAGTTLVRGDCEFMLPTERDRCLRANDSNRQIVQDRAKAKRAAEVPLVYKTQKAPEQSSESPFAMPINSDSQSADDETP